MVVGSVHLAKMVVNGTVGNARYAAGYRGPAALNRGNLGCKGA